MKAKTLASLLTTLTIAAAPLQSRAEFSEKDLLGVWKLSKFVTVDQQGLETDWCHGATGSLAYLPGQMTVGINCEATEPGSHAEALGGLMFYSGPFEVDRKLGEVIHRVRNVSHPSLNKVFHRKIAMKNPEYLSLSGDLSNGQKVIVEFDRGESFTHDANPLVGVWELVGSDNEVAGSSEKIPFCSDFRGTILYTPGGFNSVSINCGEKKDPSKVEPADQFGRKYFYSGKFKVEGAVVTQTPSNASEVFQIGAPVLRAMDITDDILTLDGTNGSKFKAKWRKLSSFVGLK